MRLLYFVAVGVVSAAIGFLVGYKVRGKKDKKEIDKLSDFYSNQLKTVDKKYRELKSSINANVVEKQEKWDAIKGELSEDKRWEKPPEERKATEQRLEAALLHRKEERQNYHAIISGSDYAENVKEPNDIIRDYADNGIYEISIAEFEEEQEFPEVELEYYEATGELVKDGEVMDTDDICAYIGYTMSELANRFMHDDSYKIYIRNPNHNCIYSIAVQEGLLK